ncbi:MAG: cation transporter [Cyanobacteria bacterium CRU_2_1]|nr:cation transporter [Cyanobacteria bacterium RU_5_0]NJR58337.1 cation transporter [Cyanobacteria bacterium CRU_2_1]
MYHYCQPGCHHPMTSHSPTHKARPLWIALILLISFAVAELGVGLFSHSLALVAESGHMLSDGLTLGLSLLATWIAQFPASNQATFGYRRIEILAALANGSGLVIVATWIGWEAIVRLQAPPDEILSLPMLITAVIGLGINSLNAFLLHDESHHDLNLRGAFLHMVADAISSVGVIVAAIAVWTLHWNRADGAISLGVAIFIILGVIPLIRQSLDILLEKTPHHLDLSQIQAHLQGFAGIERVENLRAWTIALNQDVLFAHLIVQTKDGDRDQLLRQIQTSLQQEFDIQETFLQMTAPFPPPIVNLSQPQAIDLICLSISGSPSTVNLDTEQRNS